MAGRDDGKKDEAVGRDPTAFDAFLAELSAFAPEDADRIQNVEENLAKGHVDSDPSWFARYLTEKQIRYGLAYVETGGDFGKARTKAGYGAKVLRESIEEGPAMRAYMAAIKKMVADRAMITGSVVLGRLNRIALRAEEAGLLDTAIRGNIKLGEAQGLFEKKAPTIHVNAEGVTIQIGSARAQDEDDDAAIDAVYREIAADNGLKALPGGDPS